MPYRHSLFSKFIMSSKILSPSEGMINHEDVADEYEELFETIFDLPDNIPGHPANDVWITFEKMFQVCSL